ncbi:MAG: preprotein translocase subunit SecE [Ignavibacteriales bacterium CG07_land_8_20_14_0_80_59_12]|jgi:preprotein translocase subunit SecE|nr:MAG: preprotein translocase subunit SecE [Ignavibacteriales bacterium CG07_land_8_20_14_0_80_59_12]
MKEKIIAFFSDVVREMKKVTWPKWKELQESTWVVIGVTLILSVFVYVIDLIVSSALKRIF